MTDIIITPWKRYGHHRGYAALPDGTKLGWIDVKTGEMAIEDGAERSSTEAALVAWRAPFIDGQQVAEVADVTSPPVAVEPPVAPTVTVQVAPVPSAQDWTDLAVNRPG